MRRDTIKPEVILMMAGKRKRKAEGVNPLEVQASMPN